MEKKEIIEELLKALQRVSTGTRFDIYDCCWTGDNADLEPHGQQWLHLEGVTGVKDLRSCKARATASASKTFEGLVAKLNLPVSFSLEQGEPGEFNIVLDEVKELYLTEAYRIMRECGLPADWDEDNWVSNFCVEYEVPIKLLEDGTADFEATAELLLEKGKKCLKTINKKFDRASGMLEVRSGWRNRDGETCLAGFPPAGSVWSLYAANKPDLSEASHEMKKL